MHVSSNRSRATERRAVCGKTARTVRREGGRKPMRPPYPYQRMVRDAVRAVKACEGCREGRHNALSIVRGQRFPPTREGCEGKMQNRCPPCVLTPSC